MGVLRELHVNRYFSAVWFRTLVCPLQKTFNYDKLKNTGLILDKVVNMLIYRSTFYVIMQNL